MATRMARAAIFKRREDSPVSRRSTSLASVRTGPDFRDEHTLADGRRVVLRHVAPADGPELRAAFERLSAASRYRRFFGALTHLNDATLRYLTEVDGRDHVAIVATTDSPDLMRELGLGIARFVRLREEPTVAEAAVTVVDDAQRNGLGRLLAVTLAEAARERGIHTFRADVLADNEPMRTIMTEESAPSSAPATSASSATTWSSTSSAPRAVDPCRPLPPRRRRLHGHPAPQARRPAKRGLIAGAVRLHSLACKGVVKRSSFRCS